MNGGIANLENEAKNETAKEEENYNDLVSAGQNV